MVVQIRSGLVNVTSRSAPPLPQRRPTGLLLIGQGVGAAIRIPLAGRLTDRFGGGVVSMAAAAPPPAGR
jgi:hypothetical protein